MPGLKLLLFGLLTSGVAAILKFMARVTGFHNVPEGYAGIVVRCGAVRRYRWFGPKGQIKLKHPGLRWLAGLFIDELMLVWVRQQVLHVAEFGVTFADGTKYSFKLALTIQVRDNPDDVYRAKYGVDDYQESLREIAPGLTRRVIARQKYVDLANGSMLEEKIRRAIAKRARTWGVDVRAANIGDIVPSHETERLLQVDARKSALDSALGENWQADKGAILLGQPIFVAAGAVIPHQHQSTNGHDGGVTLEEVRAAQTG